MVVGREFQSFKIVGMQILVYIAQKGDNRMKRNIKIQSAESIDELKKNFF